MYIPPHFALTEPEALHRIIREHRPGTEDEIAHAVVFLFTNGFTTGSTLYPDGGYTLR